MLAASASQMLQDLDLSRLVIILVAEMLSFFRCDSISRILQWVSVSQSVSQSVSLGVTELIIASFNMLCLEKWQTRNLM